MATTEKDRMVLFVVFEGFGVLDLTGPMTVLWSAAGFLAESDEPSYSWHVVSMKGGPVRSAEGLIIDTRPVSDFGDVSIDTIIVPGSLNIMVARHDQVLLGWLAEASTTVRRTSSVCTGAFLLAEAGLLENRRAVTHWAFCEQLARDYPSLQVETDPIYVHDGPIWTSAGSSAGIDLALALVQADCGPELAMQVARQLVVYMKRPGGQSQFSEALKVQSSLTPMFDGLHSWIAANLAEASLSVAALAAYVAMSPRNFARVYKSKTGRTPAKAIELFRLQAARQSLEETEYPIDQIARACGFGDEERMRITFQRHLGVSPRDYRIRFPSPSTEGHHSQKIRAISI